MQVVPDYIAFISDYAEAAAGGAAAPFVSADDCAVKVCIFSGRHLVRTFPAAGRDSSSVAQLVSMAVKMQKGARKLTGLVDILERVQTHLSRWGAEHN